MVWHNGWTGADWVWMSMVMVIFWGLVVAGIVLIVRSVGDSGPRPPRRPPAEEGREFPASSARRILDERYARGELSDEEYRARRDVLSGR